MCTTRLLFAAATFVLAQPIGPAVAVTATEPASSYIVRLVEGASPQSVLDQLDVKPDFTYEFAFKGFAATLTQTQVDTLKTLPVFKSMGRNAEFAMDDGARDTQSQAASSPTAGTLSAETPWNLDRIDQRDLPLNGSYTALHDGSGVTAYIIDSGITWSYRVFGNRLRDAQNFVVSDPNNDGTDCYGHGTEVASVIGGITHGVAKKVNIVALRVIDCDGNVEWSRVVAALDWIANSDNLEKPAVVNISLAGIHTPRQPWLLNSAEVDAAVDSVANKGVFVSVAAGNEGLDACDVSPGRAPGAFTVAASTARDGNMDLYGHASNYGSCVKLFAPGEDIPVTEIDESESLVSGTSFAAPHVTGVVALYKQAHGDHSNQVIRDWLINNASVDKIQNPPPLYCTPNRLLYKRDL